MSPNENGSVFNASQCFNASYNCSGNNATDLTSCNLWEGASFEIIYYFVVDVISIIGSAFIMVLVYKENQSFSAPDKLLLNQGISDISTGLLFITSSVLAALGLDQDWILLIQRSLAFVFIAESLQMLSATGLCLCLAISYPIAYRVHNRGKRVCTFIMGTWLFNVLISSLVFITDEAFNPDTMFLRFATTKLQNLWFEVLKAMCMMMLPMCGVGIFMCFMTYRCIKLSPVVESQSNTTNLVRKAIAVMTLCCTNIMFILSNILIDVIVPVRLNDLSTAGNVSGIVHMVTYHYLILKLPLFLIIFKPYRETVKAMLCGCCTETPLSTSEERQAPNTVA